MMTLPNTPMTAHLIEPARYSVLDLETGDAPAEAVEAALGAWKPPKNWKPETIEAKRAERVETINGKAALLDASPVICLSLKTDRMALILDGMSTQVHEVPGWLCLPCADEKGLLVVFRDIVDRTTGPDTVLVGHNILGFDLPKLRNAYLRHRLRLPKILMPGEEPHPVFDTIRQIRFFSAENADERYVSLDTVARVLGIAQPKQIITGADCPRLHRDGQIAEILTYCALDVATTERAFLLMTGKASDLE